MVKLNRGPFKKNRLFNVEVSEVSIVDSPANLQPFLLYKRKDGGEPMKIEKDKNLTILEKVLEGLAKIVEKFTAVEKVDTLALAKESTEAVLPVINFCTTEYFDKSKPENLAEEMKKGYTNFIKWNVTNGNWDPTQLAKTWGDWVNKTVEVQHPWNPVAAPPPIKKREEMTEDELAAEMGLVLTVAKAKCTKKTVPALEETVTKLQAMITELKKDEQPKPPEKSPLEKEFEALPEKEQREVITTLVNLNAKLDALGKTK